MRWAEILTENVTESLFRRNGGKVMPFAQLPVSAQKAIDHYMVVDGDRPEYADELLFGYALIPADQLKKAIWNSDFHAEDGMQNYYGTFDKYHKSYWSAETPSDYKNHLKEMWPIILSDDDEVIQDGWHRFHFYISQGVKLIPAVLLVEQAQ